MDFISKHRSKKKFDCQDFGKFLYTRFKAEKRTKLSKKNQKSILNESKKVLAKNILLASAKHFIQHLKESSEACDGIQILLLKIIDF